MLVKYSCIVFIALLVVSCSSGPLLTTRFIPAQTESGRQSILVFLPGRGGSINDFQAEGLYDSLRATTSVLDVVCIDAPFFYYMDRSLLPRLEKGLFDSLRVANYRNVWTVGNSMGGLGSILYARAHPGAIKNLVLLGPFLGDDPIINEIIKSGGIKNWQSKQSASDDYQRDVWMFLKACVEDTTGSYPTLFLLAGTSDRFHGAHRLLADAMAETHVFWAAGGHDWNAWRTAFGAFLQSKEVRARIGNN